MGFIKHTIFFLLTIGLSNNSIAARFWVSNIASNWNNTANWSSTSGGAGGSTVPVSTDDVNFDGSGIGNCTIDATVSIKSITVAAGYSGNIIQGANSITTVTAATFSGGTFTGGSSNITIPSVFTISGTAFTSTSAILELRSNAAFTSGSFTHNSGTVLFNGSGSPVISGTSPIFYTLEFVGKGNTYTISSTGNVTVMSSLNTSGSLFYNIASGTIDVKGDINSTNTATGNGGDATININGTGTQNFSGSSTAGQGALPKITINKASGTLNLSNFPAVSNDFTYTAGTVNAGTSTFCFTHGSVGSYTITGSVSLNNISFTVNSSGITIAIGVATTLTATGDLSIGGSGNVNLNTGNINVNGNINLINTATGGGGSATINIVGTGSQTIDGTTVIVNQSRLPIVNINKASGTLLLVGNLSFAANVTYTTGTIDPGTSTCYIVNNLTITGTFSVYNLSVSATGNTTVTISNTVTATHTLDLENGANYISINTGTIAVQGDIIDNNTNTTGGGTATILINGTGSQTITSTGVIDQGRFPAVTISKPSGTLTFPSLITVRGNWTYTSGTLDVTTNSSTIVFENTMTITGSHTLNNVTFDGSNNFTFTTAVGTTLTISGTMSMIGGSNINLTTGTINLNGNLVLTNTATGGGGTSVIAFVSGGNQAITSSLPVDQSGLPAITINKSGGTLTFPTLITVKGNWTYTAGVLDVTTNNSTVVFASPLGSGAFSISGSHSLNHVTFEGNNNNTATMSTGTVLTVTGTLTTTGPSNVFINSASAAGTTVINALGDIIINNTSVTGGGTGLILINGTGSQAFTSTAAANQGLMPYLTIQKTSGTLTLTGIISESRDWTYTSGTVDATTNSSTVVFGGNALNISSNGMNFYHVTVASSTCALTNTLSVNGNLTVNGTGVLAPGANTINLTGNWSNRATAGLTESTSTINFNGSALQTVTTPGGENFTNLTINNSGVGIQLVNNTTVATTLTMTQGNIDLNSNTLTLGLSAASKGTLARTIGTMIGTGSFTRWFNTTAVVDGAIAGLFPMGTAANYRPFYVSAPVTAPTSGGTITVSYTDATTNSTVSFADGASTVTVRKNLNWAVSTANSLAGGLYNLRAEGTGFGTVGSVNDLRITLVSSVLATAGTNAGTISNPQVNRTGLSLANLSNTFYVGSINAVNSPLPITLISFTVTAEHERVRLDWETSYELNNEYFTVQRSVGLKNWETIKVIKGLGDTKTNAHYTAYDENPISSISYYRLKQTDLNDENSYSFIRSVNMSEVPFIISTYPNPATNFINIKSNSISSEQIDFVIYSSDAQKVKVPNNYANNILTLDISDLSGVYLIQVSQGGYSVMRRIIIKLAVP